MPDNLISEPVPVGTRLADSLPYSSGGTADQAKALKASGVDGVFVYLGVCSAPRLEALFDAGLGVMAVTLADRFDGDMAVSQLKLLELPKHTVWLDHEGTSTLVDAVATIDKSNAWSKAISDGGWDPGGYFGVPQPMTSAEMTALILNRYWRGQGSIRDRNSALAEPKSGWCVTQMYPSVERGGVLVDLNMVGADYFGRVPTWVRRNAV